MDASEFLAARHSFPTPIDELDRAAALLDAAVRMMAAKRDGWARELIEAADIPALFTYTATAAGTINAPVHRLRPVAYLPPALPKADRVGVARPDSPLGRGIFMRDGWRCRYCQCKVIPAEMRKIVDRALPGAIRWSDTSLAGCHTGFIALWGTIDHVLPHSRGGNNDPSNLVTACFVCQFGRGDYTLEQVGLSDPRGRAPIVDGWDGLCRLTPESGRAAARSAVLCEA